MEYRKLGKTGLPVSALSLGSWLTFGKQIDNDTADRLMTFAYDQGINFFDNAEIYARGRSEQVMGEILKKKGWPRDSYLVSSKVYFGYLGKDAKPTQRGLHRKHVVEACEQALKRLGLDYLDLYFCHRPDKEVPIEETVWTMHNLIVQGKILYWGTSEWSAQEIFEAHAAAARYSLIGPAMEQPQYNMLERHRVEVEYGKLYKTFGLGTTIWSPLASGVLSGKYNQTPPSETRLNLPGMEWLKDSVLAEKNLAIARKLAVLANRLGISQAVLAIAWCLKNPNVSTVILGASREEQLRENLRALEAQAVLSPEVMEEIEQILQNKPQPPAYGGA
ncbi:MAG: NADP-dependent aryl-alcohol dehydrogenase [Cyclobacteriaceae bacterium]|nr:MAG: NADP-dependent aryl-alcohol dehydrogenase [Cyclobacteriaceae bacterium]